MSNPESTPTEDPFRQLLSEGLDLCVRARQIDRLEDAAMERAMRDPHKTRSGTIPLWMHEQYEIDRADWEKRARKALMS